LQGAYDTAHALQAIWHIPRQLAIFKHRQEDETIGQAQKLSVIFPRIHFAARKFREQTGIGADKALAQNADCVAYGLAARLPRFVRARDCAPGIGQG